jgi:hypothetical protein
MGRFAFTAAQPVSPRQSGGSLALQGQGVRHREGSVGAPDQLRKGVRG